jgi:hypothetical protein
MPRRLALAALVLCALPSSALANPSFSVSMTAGGVPGNLPSEVTHRLTLTGGAAQESVRISTVGSMSLSGSGYTVDEQTATGPGVFQCPGRWTRVHEARGAESRRNVRLTLAPFATANIDTKTSFRRPPWASDTLDAAWDITPAQGTEFTLVSTAPTFQGAYGVELGFDMARVSQGVYAVIGTAESEVDSGRAELWGYAPGQSRARRLAVARVRDSAWSIAKLRLPRTGRWEFYARYRTAKPADFADDASICGTIMRIR